MDYYHDDTVWFITKMALLPELKLGIFYTKHRAVTCALCNKKHL